MNVFMFLLLWPILENYQLIEKKKGQFTLKKFFNIWKKNICLVFVKALLLRGFLLLRTLWENLIHIMVRPFHLNQDLIKVLTLGSTIEMRKSLDSILLVRELTLAQEFLESSILLKQRRV